MTRLIIVIPANAGIQLYAQSLTLDFRQGDELKGLDSIPSDVYIVTICS
jgi:hypothetical protein